MENDNGIIELVFSPNDQRQFRDGNGHIITKQVPLITDRLVNGQPVDKDRIPEVADKRSYAPTRNRGMLTKMHFDWAFNEDELLIHLNMEDREINKQTIYLTVRDV